MTITCSVRVNKIKKDIDTTFMDGMGCINSINSQPPSVLHQCRTPQPHFLLDDIEKELKELDDLDVKITKKKNSKRPCCSFSFGLP